MDTNNKESRAVRVSRASFYLAGIVFALCVVLIAISDGEVGEMFFSMRDIIEIPFVFCVCPAIIVISLIGCFSGIFAIGTNKFKQGIAGSVFNLLILLACCWYMLAFNSRFF